MTKATDYECTNDDGVTCIPHVYKDGKLRAARYVSGDPEWYYERNYIIFPERELPMMMADPELEIRCSPEKTRKSPTFFSVKNIRKRP